MYSYGEPVSARFTTVDPIRDGSNWFSYVVNDPVNYVDSLGLTASDSKVNSNNNSSNSSAEVVGIAIENFCNEMAIGFDMATNLDFGFDYSQVATQAWSNGNYLTAAAYEVGASLEVIMDVGIAYYSAGVFGGVVEGARTAITTGSLLRGYIAAEQQINQFTEDFTNSVTKTWNTVSSNISNTISKIRKTGEYSSLETEYARVDNISNIEKYGQNLGKDGQLFLTDAKTVNGLDLTTKSGLENAEDVLGLPRGQLSNSEINVVTTVNTAGLNIRLPTSGNEFFIPGGITSGGAPEIVVDPMNIFTDPSVSSIQFIQKME